MSDPANIASATPRGKAAGDFLRTIWLAVGGEPAVISNVTFTGEGDLQSVFPVSDLAVASLGAAALAVAELIGTAMPRAPAVRIDRRLASFWYGRSLDPQGWSAPPLWGDIAGDYPTADGWIKLHTNAPHHRKAAIAALGGADTKDAVRTAVAQRCGDELEAAVLAHGGCAAVMRSQQAWAEHPQGNAVAAEPLVWSEATDSTKRKDRTPDPARPLAGVRVLDLTRIIAGPAATRFLAGFGADVLRIDPPGWEEPNLEPEVTLGKRCTRLNLRDAADRERLLELLAQADIIVHGLRPGALDGLGLGAAERHRARPGLIDVSLDAYGWTGPWAGRRGYDSLVQMSSGIAETGMRLLHKDQPTPLPVQALDHATGCIVAAAALRGLTTRTRSGAGSAMRASLARTAALLTSAAPPGEARPLEKPRSEDYDSRIETTPWGPARRLRPAVTIDGTAMQWDRPATTFGSSPPNWAG
jgi:crotonobetainyl-CoA:carnitine CoA-transferase CaiB-like acyl-CoA transferase